MLSDDDAEKYWYILLLTFINISLYTRIIRQEIDFKYFDYSLIIIF